LAEEKSTPPRCSARNVPSCARKSYAGGGRLVEPVEATNPSESGCTSTPRPVLETNPERVGTKSALSSGGPTSLRWQERTIEPRPSLVARATVVPVSPAPPEQMPTSAAQSGAAGTRPGQAPVAEIRTPSPAAICGSQARKPASGVSGGAPASAA